MNNGVISNAVWTFISIGCFVIGMLIMVEISTKDCPQYECAITRPSCECICEDIDKYRGFYYSCCDQRAEYREKIHDLQLELRVCEIYNVVMTK